MAETLLVFFKNFLNYGQWTTVIMLLASIAISLWVTAGVFIYPFVGPLAVILVAVGLGATAITAMLAIFRTIDWRENQRKNSRGYY